MRIEAAQVCGEQNSREARRLVSLRRDVDVVILYLYLYFCLPYSLCLLINESLLPVWTSACRGIVSFSVHQIGSEFVRCC